LPLNISFLLLPKQQYADIADHHQQDDDKQGEAHATSSSIQCRLMLIKESAFRGH
jgi:hypothetical protein